MNHRLWEPGVWGQSELLGLRVEHNALHSDWRAASLESERLAKANGDACDRIAELEQWKQETLDKNNRLDRELDEARQRIKELESEREVFRDRIRSMDSITNEKIAYAKELEGDISNAVQNAIDRLPNAPWKDKTATEAVWLLSLAVSNVESRPALTCEECEAEINHHGGGWHERFIKLESWLKSRLPAPVAETTPIRVPFTDAQIERMSDAGRKAFGGMGCWENVTDEGAALWKLVIRAALAAGGLEPCPVPQYAPEDVALCGAATADEYIDCLIKERDDARERLAKTAAKSARRRTACKQMQSALAAAQLTATKLHATIKHRKQQGENIRANYDRILADKKAAIARVAELEVGIAREKAAYTQLHSNGLACNDAIRAELEAVRAERDAARPQPGPVKVRLPEAVDIYDQWSADEGEGTKNAILFTLNYCRAHAVIDVPAGVPSVKELVEIYESKSGFVDFDSETRRKRGAGITAIRDAVLAGYGQWYKRNPANSYFEGDPKPPVWTDDQIEALADRLDHAWVEKYGLPSFTAARAAVEFMRVGPPVQWHGAVDFAKPASAPSVDSDAWIENFKAQSCAPNSEDCFMEINPREKFCEFIIHHGDKCMYLSTSPSDAARLALWAASYAGAHGCPVNLRPPKSQKLKEMLEANPQESFQSLTMLRPTHRCPTRAEAEAKWKECWERDLDWNEAADRFHDWLLPQLPEGEVVQVVSPPASHAEIIKHQEQVQSTIAGVFGMAPKEPEGEDAPLEPAQKCLSCGAPRHTGQPCSYCNPAKPEPIATLETLDALAEAGENAYQSAYQADKSCAECRAAQVVAIIRAAQAYVDVSPSLLEKWLLENECDNLHCREILARMNSRIRYRVAVPSKTPKGLPTVDMIMSLLKESKDSRSVQAQASTILTALRPWLRDPVGWELPTFEEYRDVRNEEADKSQDWNDQLEFEYHWLRSRIRPTFECAECAKRKTDIKGCVQNIESAASFIRAALEGE